MTAEHNKLSVRPVTPADVGECGRICYQAFASIAEAHRFPLDFPSIESATDVVSGLITHPDIFGVVVESGVKVVGANFLDKRSTIFGVGPVVVDPHAQDRGVGRALMAGVLQHAAGLNPPGIRLLQAAYHNRSMTLYSKMGFQVRDSFAAMRGEPLGLRLPGYPVRAATVDDTRACSELCWLVHGHDRRGEFTDALLQGSAMVVERNGRITGYTTGIQFYSHSVAETSDDIIALIAASEQMPFGAGFLVPMRNTQLMQWCLTRGFRVTYMMNLMSLGLYQEPQGAFLASVGY